MTSISADKRVRESSLFDPQWYQRQYSDVAGSGLSPEQHYLKYGWLMGRDPGPGFSTKEYLQRNSDVRRAGINPLIHYLRLGQLEGRAIFPSSSARPGSTADAGMSSTTDNSPQLSAGREMDNDGRLSSQLDETQRLLEVYFKRCQELEIRLGN